MDGIRPVVPCGVKVGVNFRVTFERMMDRMGIKQRTYPKKKKEKATLDPRFIESILELATN
ncbi:hypothetical protein [Saccharicrinis sp. GN24d3]|uniref:hypothetical protein n=1 Tax=Saccharicrinis sp. GN24d3 TaxID=3458416 RepID=UPI00403621D6